jgi:hypothetical protein
VYLDNSRRTNQSLLVRYQSPYTFLGIDKYLIEKTATKLDANTSTHHVKVHIRVDPVLIQDSDLDLIILVLNSITQAEEGEK